MIYQDLTCKSCLILQSCKMTLKRGVTDALQIRALGIQLAGSGCKIVREQNETLGIERASDVDLFDRRLRRNPVGADACPDVTLRIVCRRRCNLDLFLKNCGVG